MKNIYQESIQAVENGTKFKVDFKIWGTERNVY